MLLSLGRDAALVPDVRRQSATLGDLLERRVDLGPHSHGLTERRNTDRRDHELLEVDRVISVRTAVDDVEARDGEDIGRRSAEEPEQRNPKLVRRCVRVGERYAEQRVRAELLEVRRAVEERHRFVESALVERVAADDVRTDLVDHCRYGLAHTFADVAIVAIAELMGFERSG